MIMNETIQSILDRRSHKIFKSDPIDNEILDTIVEAGKYAPTGMNRQNWHFTVIKSKEGKEKFTAAVDALYAAKGKEPSKATENSIPDSELRGAPVLIVVSGDADRGTSREDCVLATENMYIAAASFGVMSGWTHMTTKDLFSDPAVKREFLIPGGYEVYSASFFGYPAGEPKDRGPRKEGTVTVL